WTGWYFGGNIGGGWGHRDIGFVPNDVLAAGLPIPSSMSFDTSGVIGGLQAGFNYQYYSNWLIGVEADFNWSNMRGSASASFGTHPPLTESVDERDRWFGTVRARVGYVPFDRFLTFVTGGFAYGKVERSANYANNTSLGFGSGIPGLSFGCSPFAVCF